MNEPDDYLWSGEGPADPEVARLEALLRPLAHDPARAPLDELRAVRGRRRRRAWIGAAVLAAAAAAAVLIGLLARRPATPCSGSSGFAFAGTGALACGGGSVARGVLPVGGTLDTGASEADLAIADIGSAHLSAGTRVQLVGTSAARHELFLDRGRLHARVTAPPRLFAVGTPSARVVDLGCEYELEIDASGAGSLRVITGQVELEADGAVISAPQGTVTHLRAKRRASLPLAAPPSADLARAVTAWETSGDAAAVLAAAAPRDAITILALAQLSRGDDRAAALRRLAELFPPPTTPCDVLSSLARGGDDPAQIDDARLAAWQAQIVRATMLERR